MTLPSTSRRTLLRNTGAVLALPWLAGCSAKDSLPPGESSLSPPVESIESSQNKSLTSQQIRSQNLARLKEEGFTVSGGLPLRSSAKLRPILEVAQRLIALDALFTWVSDLDTPEKDVRSYGELNSVVKWLTPKEEEIWKLPRDKAHEDHVDDIGWRLENMWPLAWVLGYKPLLTAQGGMISDNLIQDLLLKFMPGLEGTAQTLLDRKTQRSFDEVATLEDYFYCAHNAVRSAQLGGTTVPGDFNPISDGGTVHERRHALTWCLSPGVAWDDTDLST